MGSPHASSVEAVGLVRRFDGTAALDRVSLRIPENSFYCLLGPSGCGKTTLLRLIAGLDTPDEGRVLIGGRDHTATPAHRRPTNLVFQSGALFPHMSVRDNIDFGLRSAGVRGPRARERVEESLELVAMGEFADRMPQTLSGGQRQRVAIARSLVKRPDVLLLDEPLSALDLSLQLHMRRELKRWQQETGTTFVCVTHNQAEAMEMADEIAVMRAGRIEQAAAPEHLYEAPATRFVADFIGENNVFTGLAADRGGARADHVFFPGVDADLVSALAVRPERIRLVDPGAPESAGTARVVTVGFTGRTLRIGLTNESGRELLAELPAGTRVQAGDTVGLAFDPDAVVRIPARDTEAAA
ncbi:ABC transporter ATP-binding protein [Nocardiopsis flavescens]|uniref:ABC-type quaternary amine transporter n=1 Tax=Nocardiopsis flavescens TaxID=758803 RepID=A0A1M6CS40_9ACTN|nr:ABC transporter ATP-binding protein [Nocardiopsis flavescens]SHI63842.1 putative spermidine/putrescine transport system ATP-binding protein/spermidine/putrescine transport system ATP-binding protein/putrescine transport system ATP-binding protein [Nocardiopsis flavescens]